MFSSDPTTQRILREFKEWNDEKDQINREAKQEFESKWHKEFAILPTRTTSGKFVWFNSIWRRYQGVPKKFIKISGKNGSLEVTDPIRHYMYHDYTYGGVIECLNRKEYDERFGIQPKLKYNLDV